MDIYTKIKRQNGEAFAKAIRNYDNGIFDIPGIVDMLKYAGRDAEVLMNYLVSLKNIQIQVQEVSEDPIELLDKAGYDAYVVTALTDDDNPNFDPNNPKTWVGQNTIQCYYAPEEKLCTFRDPQRFEKYFIINAVDPNVKKIKRGNPPKREDKYGTSVISIQVLKEGGFISIKNRYNHRVGNPDNTFGSNPDNIILGLSDAIRHRFGVDFSSQNLPLPEGFIRIRDQEGKDRIVRYHTEVNGYYFGSSYYVKNGVLTKVGGHEILLEHFVLNLKDGTVKDVARTNDALSKLLKNAISGKKIQITKDKDGVQHLLADDQEVLTMKDGCLISMNIPRGVTEIGEGAFRGCSSFQSIVIPSCITKIGEWAFKDCSSLQSIVLSDGVTKIEAGTFSGCTNLTSVHIPRSVTEIGSYAFSNCTNLTSVYIPDGVTKIECGAFSECTNLTFVNIPRSVMEIEIGTFWDCSSLTSIEIPRNVRKIGYQVFKGCTSLTTLHIPNSVIEIGNEAFKGCTSLTTLRIPESVTKIGWGVFEECTNLTSVHIPDSVTKIEYQSFQGCTSLTTLHIPDSVIEIGNDAFTGCTSLTTLHIPNSVTEIECGAFSGCTNLASIRIPNSVTEIKWREFDGCINLTSINIPNSVTAIAQKAFKDCINLTTLRIPESVTYIGKDAFEGCKKLRITCNERQAQMIKEKGGFKGRIKIAPKVLTRQANLANITPKKVKKSPTI